MQNVVTTPVPNRQTELWLDYQNAQSGLDAALTSLKKSINALIAGGVAPAEVAKAISFTTTKLEANAQEIRKRIVRVVKIHALNKSLKFKEIWRIVYARLQEATGINVIARAVAAGKQVYLDIVEELGLLQKTLDIAAAL